jgi:choloylglycine hydrolase
MMKKILWGIIFTSCIHACTAFQLKSQEGGYVYCRSLEFAFPMASDVLIVPRMTKFTGTAPQGKPGLQWSSMYGYEGLNQKFDTTLVIDGMNEKGLIVGCLYLPGYAQYETPDPTKNAKTLGPWELTSYLLGTCATLEDVKTAVKDIVVANEAMPAMGDFIFPLHFYVTDATGNVLIIEYVNGVRQEYSNPLGVLTNSPPFDWQLINLGSFINLSPTNIPLLQLGDFNVHNYGQGSGLLGLPGDYTPPSRFVRATLFSQWAASQNRVEEAVCMGFHILNTFDIFEGIVRNPVKAKTPLATDKDEITEWVVVHDRTNLKTYFRTYGSLQIQMIDMKKIDFSKAGLRKVVMNRAFIADDVTTHSQPL